MRKSTFFASLVLLAAASCSSGSGTPVVTGDYVVFAWNDLGMHCLNPTYDTLVILPPYNTVWVQVIKRGVRPEIVSQGLTMAYELVDNTRSYGKTDDLGADFAGFWDHCQDLFGVSLAHDKGLNLVEPNVHNGLAGEMTSRGTHWQVDGIPAVPVKDDGTWTPYQQIRVTARDATGKTLATTQTTLPTSDEINCARCHGADALNDILAKHDAEEGTGLSDQKPVLCARCHGSQALGGSGPGSSGKYLSQAIHGFHAEHNASCYDCHPGPRTLCMRSLAHTAPGGNCVACHGTLAQVASSVENGTRVPWANEPACSQCHAATIPQVETGGVLFRNAFGHGGVACAACHGSPHAMLPSREAADNQQAVAYTGSAQTIGSCSACHSSSRGKDFADFGEAHGGAKPEARSACHVCHTEIPSLDPARWPHAFAWKDR